MPDDTSANTDTTPDHSCAVDDNHNADDTTSMSMADDRTPEQRVAALEQQLADKDQLIRDLEQREQIGNLLRDADAIDVDAAHLLTEAALAAMDEPDLEQAVRDLKRTRPYLFRNRPRPSVGQSPRGTSDGTAGPRADDAAAEAAATGHRRDLLRYLRLRRESQSRAR